ncbi:hypothetical protein Bca52824_008135 [Brassica carinata]|uniref:V-SNARE coiled-coil homology domain-containing protein n=1 Tax=Brassica carinata TaxID=52824 RepID=A0A8X8B8X2_BRACI|nr:hypothetical protein Bca52824_008135 [Brassica carinata]
MNLKDTVFVSGRRTYEGLASADGVFSSNLSVDTLNRVRGEVSEIRSVMVENIEKMMERGDRIELLVEKTATTQDSSFHLGNSQSAYAELFG